MTPDTVYVLPETGKASLLGIAALVGVWFGIPGLCWLIMKVARRMTNTTDALTLACLNRCKDND